MFASGYLRMPWTVSHSLPSSGVAHSAHKNHFFFFLVEGELFSFIICPSIIGTWRVFKEPAKEL